VFSQYDGEAMTSMPPNIPSFDPAKREPALHPMCHTTSAASMAPPAVNANDISSLTSMLLLRTVQDLTCNQDNATIPSTPVPTIRAFASVLTQSPAILTPSKLTRFLEYAEQELGVSQAMMYESSLHSIGAGLDILVEIADQELARIGLTPGDIIRLKKGSVTWWNGPLAKNELMDSTKRKRSDTTNSEIPEDRRYQYEKRYHDGGRARINGGRMRVEERPPGEFDGIVMQSGLTRFRGVS
jgi:hypothetical protein